MYKENKEYQDRKPREGKDKRPKRNFNLPAFTDNEGNIITYAIGVKVPQADNDRPEARKSILETALKIFKRKVKESGIIEDYKSRTEFIKPSVKKRRMKEEAIRRAHRPYRAPLPVEKEI